MILSGAAHAQVYETYEFDVPAERYALGAPVASQRFLDGEPVYGRVKFEACRVTEDFDSGFRFMFEAGDGDAGYTIGFVCLDLDDELLFTAVTYDSDGQEFLVADVEAGNPREWIHFKMQVSGPTIQTTFDDHTFTTHMPASWKIAQFYSYCAQGIVEFYDPINAVS